MLKTYAYSRFQEKLQDLNRLSTEHKYLEAVSLIEEFLRVGIGAELIALEKDVYFRGILNEILNRELEEVHRHFNRLAGSQIRKDQPSVSKDIQYSVVLSERGKDDILRGVASGDCTAINGSAFYNTIPQFLFDPGFLDFKILQDDKWVGNVYAIVAEKDNNPVLIIDAIQLPVWGRSWPVSVTGLADKVLEKVIEYAKAEGFSQVVMSSFVSNFSAIHEHFSAQYPAKSMEIEKVGGFEHLKSLGLWDPYANRNEYLETFSPQWNYGFKRVDPNNPKQNLLLRRVWERGPPSQEEEQLIESTNETTKSTSSKQNVGLSNGNGLYRFIQHNFKKIVVTAIFIVMFALPNITKAANFEIVKDNQSNQSQVVAVVEKGDNLWDIAGTAYKGTENIGQGQYAANAQWSKIYENKINQKEVLGGREHKVGPEYPDTRQIVNIRPGDRLVIPGQVNLKAMGLESSTQIQTPAPETKPSVVEVKPSQGPGDSQQKIKAQNEEHKLQQQKSQAEQQLTRLYQEKQTAQDDLENLQKQKQMILFLLFLMSIKKLMVWLVTHSFIYLF